MRPVLLAAALFSAPLFAIVSIAPVDIGSAPGWSGNLSGSLSSKSGNTEKDEYSLGGRIQYDQGSNYLAWGTMTYEYGESSGVKNEESIYAHLRSIHALGGNGWCGELFAQTEQDEFRDIRHRSLAGAGVRWRFFDSPELGRGYVGAGAMGERIRYTGSTVSPNEENTRFNTYIAYTRGFGASSRFSYVGYFQPKADDGSDYVTSQSGELIVPVAGRLNLGLTAKYLYDSRPIPGIDKEDRIFQTSLMWAF